MEIALWLTLVGNVLVLLTVIWNVLCWQRILPLESVPQGTTPSDSPTMAVLIPARNEAANLPDCLRSVVDQGSVVSEIIVLDDNSTDATAEVLQSVQLKEPRLKLIRGLPLEAGWCGKTWACQQLGNAAGAEWLLFLDADARLLPGAAAALVNSARCENLTFLGAWPGVIMRSAVEMWLMPMLNFLTFSLYPAELARLRPADASLGLGHGACLLMKRDTYRRLGGHQPVAKELFEDTQLARHWRRSGERSLCLDGQSIVRVRMYSDFAGIWQGFRKNFYPAFGKLLPFLSFVGLRLSLSLAPFLLLPLTLPNGRLLVVAASACTLVLLQRLLIALRFRHPLWPILLHMPAELVLTGIAISSWFNYRHGHGVVWKDRLYHA